MVNLTGKKIILICPKYYNYETIISHCLEKRGASVETVYENLERIGLYYRLITAYFPGRKSLIAERYYRKRLFGIISDAAYCIVIRGSTLTPAIMSELRTRVSPHCVFSLYQWDSIRNNPTAEMIAPFFDHVFTFDPEDAEKKGWTYRPLFYITEYLAPKKRRDHDILYFCSLHSNRVKILNRLKEICKENNYRLQYYLYMNRFLYYKYKYLDKKKEMIEANNRDISFKKISLPESNILYGSSKVVFDYTPPNQTGFTMRTIESLGNRCKLMTNNSRIIDADFYRPENIIVYQEDNIEIPESFIQSPFSDIPDEIMSKYSLEEWLSCLLGGR